MNEYSSSDGRPRQNFMPTKIMPVSKENTTREKQREFALSCQKQLKLGDKWYLISSDWYNRWASYVALDQKQKPTEIPPDRISNKKLFEQDVKSQVKKLKLKDSLIEEIDYFIVSYELWHYLVSIYGLESPEDKIEREVIDDSVANESDIDSSNLKIEIRRLNVLLECQYNTNLSPNTVISRELSRQTKLDTVIQMMKEAFNVPADKKVRLYFKPPAVTRGSAASPNSKNEATMLTPIEVNTNSTLTTAAYGQDDTIVMRVLTDEEADSGDVPVIANNGSQSSQPKAVPPAPVLPTPASLPPPYTSTRYSTNMSRNHSSSNYSTSERQGLCGLSNLGNTCFMNSALQCMSNVPLLTDYFIQGRYKAEINKLNPLGRQGEIAEAYAHLVSEIWSGANSYTIPRQFKLALSKFAPQFTGYQQQDSQELLAFLLDGLHEDLNRILKKPYVELGSHVGKSDEVFAEESWQDHKKRNDSIIVDIFHGLLKSTLNCLVCQEISIKFDPFCYLSVPLPSKKERLIEVVFVPIDSTQPLIKCKVSVLKNGTMQDLCASLESLIEKDASILNKVSKSKMIVCDVYSNKFFKIYESSESVTSIREQDDIYIYELQTTYNNLDYLKIKLHLREKINSHSSNSSCFGLPLFFMVPKDKLTYGSLYQYCLRYLKRFLKNPLSNGSEEINSKLNNSLNVNDEEPVAPIDQDAETANGNSNNESDDDSDERLKPANVTRSSKPFSLHVSKSDNIDYDSSTNSTQITDDTPFEWTSSSATTTTSSYSFQSSQQSSQSQKIASLCADFTTAQLKRNYKRSQTASDPHAGLLIEHSSCQTAQLIKQRKDVISLADCFSLYTKTEELSEQDYWYCSKCKSHQASTKKFDLWSLPPVLVVHLKRFSYSRLYRDKIDTLVDFPLTDLDMAPYLINKNAGETRYNLIGVSNHYGSLGGGHYTAYGQNRCDSKWYYFDDSSVSNSEESNVCTPAAYMLIYLRKDLHQKHIGIGALTSNHTSNHSQIDDEPSLNRSGSGMSNSYSNLGGDKMDY